MHPEIPLPQPAPQGLFNGWTLLDGSFVVDCTGNNYTHCTALIGFKDGAPVLRTAFVTPQVCCPDRTGIFDWRYSPNTLQSIYTWPATAAGPTLVAQSITYRDYGPDGNHFTSSPSMRPTRPSKATPASTGRSAGRPVTGGAGRWCRARLTCRP